MKYATSPTPTANHQYPNYPRSTSPLPAPANYQPTVASAAVKRYKYLRRLFKFNQMDFEFAAWQMVYLFIAPQKVFRNFNYRKREYFCLFTGVSKHLHGMHSCGKSCMKYCHHCQSIILAYASIARHWLPEP